MTLSAPAAAPPAQRHGQPESAPRRAPGLAAYFAVGLFFGILLVKAEVISWFRIQEMFRFQGFHMFGIFATALPVAIISVQLIKRRGARTLSGEPVTIPPKTMGSGMRYIVGGITFGLGWALTGACPGPLFALLGSGIGVITMVIISATAGTWTYGYLRPKLPH
jgi:uncharacterized membrane protein YedE/YeeE